jgi:pantoate--beta-alanine ligase
MDIVDTVAGLRQRLAGERSVVLVPTMGNLHQGHYALMQLARAHGSCVVATIFVNRLQFAPTDDFDRYPRTFEADCAGLVREGVDVLFVPGERELYPERQEFMVDPGDMGNLLEGLFRPGFFQGVCTVVLKLFNIVAPQVAVFGKKDRQQLQIVERMVRQLALPVRIVAAETARAPDGLALSSRNSYLSAEERAEAPRLQRVLRNIVATVEAGGLDYASLELAAVSELRAHGWNPDYVAVRQRAGLQLPAVPPSLPDTGLVVLGAAWLGRTRLIDNLDIHPHL